MKNVLNYKSFLIKESLGFNIDDYDVYNIAIRYLNKKYPLRDTDTIDKDAIKNINDKEVYLLVNQYYKLNSKPKYELFNKLVSMKIIK